MSSAKFKVKFKKGDKAFFPAQGVGVIRGVESQDIGGFKQEFYVVQVISSGATLMIPTTGPAAERSGMRHLISEKEIENVFKILKRPKKVNVTTWNRRYREYNEKLRTGEPKDVAEVLRDLYTLRGTKDLSFGEKNMLEKARSLIAEEISESRRAEMKSIEEQLDNVMVLN
jgi:CarD family transcriptional regulator